MFTSKLEVDKHVENSIKKINNEKERNLRGYAFAKLYYKVGAYENARRYVSAYLDVKTSAEAYNLLGKIFEKQEKYDSALEAYCRSFDLDSKQNTLLLKICELLALENTNFDMSGARYYCQKAQKIDPTNPVLYSLKEKIIQLESNNPEDVTKFYLSELQSDPNNINTQIKLLQHLLEHDQINEAYKHVLDQEQKNLSICSKSFAWYEIASQVLLKYQRLSNNLSWEYYVLLISVLEKVVALNLDESFSSAKTNLNCIKCTYTFDQTLLLADEKLKNCPERPFVQEFIKHYKGQLSLHLSTLLFQQAKKDLLNFKEAFQTSLPLLFVAFHTEPPDLQSMWLNNAEDKFKRLVKRWHVEGSHRCSQAGHMLISAAKNKKHVISEKAQQFCSGLWRNQIFKKLFFSRDQQANMDSSFFLKSSLLNDINTKVPGKEDVLVFDKVAQLLHPSSLHHLIWIGLNTVLPNFDCLAFEGLPYSVKYLESSSAESMSLLDIQTFFYCSVFCAESQIEESKKNIITAQKDKPELLPVSLTGTLGTINQHKWFSLAYQMYKKQPSHSFTEIRTNLVKGLQVIRCVGNHGLDVKLLAKLARVFAERANICTKHSQIEANNARAELFWKTALKLLEKLKNNQAVIYGKERLFEYKSRDLTTGEISSMISEGQLFLATRLMTLKHYEEALNILENLTDPYASFYQGKIYLKIADEEVGPNKSSLSAESLNRYLILLIRAKDSFYLTLDRLRNPSVDRNHPLNAELATEIENTEKILSQIDRNPDNEENNSNFVVSSPIENSRAMHNSSFSTTNGLFTPKKDSSLYLTPRLENTFRSEARPSPERLDAQIRQMQSMRDTAYSQFIEQNKLIIEALRDIKKSLNDLKDAVEDMQNYRDVTDMVKEMKKEIAELKSNMNKPHKPSQLSEEDLYVLDEEYGNDYNINSNLGNLNQNLYPGFQNRVPPANPLPYGLYPGMYPSLYQFAGLGLPQPGVIPFSQDAPLSDLRGLTQTLGQTPNMFAQQNLSQSSLNQNALGQALSNPTLGILNQSLVNSPSTGGQLPFSQLNLSQMTLGPSTTLSQPSGLTGAPLFKDKSDTNLNLSGLGLASQPSSSVPSSKAPPVNIVITTSDPLPKTAAPTTQVLSVTIPPQHLKGNIPNKTQPHNYQIPVTTTVFSAPSSIISSYQSPMSSGSMLTSSEKSPLKSTPEKSKSNTSTSNNFLGTEHDPIPDFKPIIPLPDEVPLVTGEENEIVLFCNKAKLLRFDNKEWKERGIGDLKILKNKTTGKIRLLMRRENIHKICANHFLTEDLKLMQMPKCEKAYNWIANDFSEEKIVRENFCARFKTVEDAKKFQEVFEKAQQEMADANKAKSTSTQNSSSLGTISKPEDSTAKPSTSQPPVTAALGGFVFTSTPTFKPKETVISTPTFVPKQEEPVKTTPFASFSFIKDNTSTPSSSIFAPSKQASNNESKEESHDEDDFKPTVEFKPVVPLPDLVEVKTGEEDSIVLFECRAKLYRFDSEKKEWKERGIGNIKLLKDKTVRLIMRRDQVFKVCCNHQLLKDMKFTKKNAKALSWYAQDYSEGVLTPEMFSIRFKEESQADDFLKAIQSAQEEMGDNSFNLEDAKPEREKREAPKDDKKMKSSPPEPEPKPTDTGKAGHGDKLKPKSSIWKCKNCFFENEKVNAACVACETPKSGATPKTSDTGESGSQFSFGMSPTNNVGFNFSPQTSQPSKPTSLLNWGDAFKPKEGFWECIICYVSNDASKDKCIACETPRTGSTPSSKSTVKGGSVSQFSFGMSQADNGKLNFSPKGSEPSKATAMSNWGDAFKPKEGFWECTICYVSNDASKDKCIACETPRTGSTPSSKSTIKGVDLTTPGFSFTFGIPTSNTNTTNSPSGTLISDKGEKSEKTKDSEQATTPFPTFSFGNSKNPEQTLPDLATSFKLGSSSFNFTPKKPVEISKDHAKAKDSFTFGSPQKYTFEFSPVSPRRQNSGGGDEESDHYTEDDGEQIYFKPVIPLPDKVEVKTGEEDEEVLYCHRAKLFRHVEGAWKERGIGDVKILYQPNNKKLRVLMRRDQVFKICLNHWLTKDVQYHLKDDKTWLFSAADFSEGEINHWTFCLRFKDASIAAEFKKAVENALEKSTNQKSSEKSGGDSDVEFVSETVVTPEEEKEALRLGLPPKFMAYRQLPDCTCSTCQKDDKDEAKSSTEIKQESKNVLNAPKFLFGSSTPATAPVSTTFSFGSATNTSGKSTPMSTKSTETSSINTFTFSFTPSSLETSKQLGQTTVTKNDAVTTSSTSKNIFSFQMPSSNNFSTSGGSIFSFPATTNSSTSIFGTPSNQTGKPAETGGLFNKLSDTNKTEGIFGNTAGGDFSLKSVDQQKTDSDSNEQVLVPGFLQKDPGISFASLAATTKTEVPLKKNEGENPFAHLGLGVPVFSSIRKSGDNSDTANACTASGDAEVEYDPYFEPIVPLPGEITVVTGEEDEIVQFCERAKLYRFANGEWKERGVGNIKILYHPQKGTFRLLLRREQVHKLILNMLITTQFELLHMNNVERGWMFVGLNYLDETQEVEKLAVRFKNASLAENFQASVDKAISTIKTQQDKPQIEEVEEDDDDGEVSDDNDHEERELMFKKRCKLSEWQPTGEWKDVYSGDIEISYGSFSYGVTVTMVDENNIYITYSTITRDSTIDLKDNSCTWTALETAEAKPYERKLRATFDDPEQAEEFQGYYQEGIQWAKVAETDDNNEAEDAEN